MKMKKQSRIDFVRKLIPRKYRRKLSRYIRNNTGFKYKWLKVSLLTLLQDPGETRPVRELYY